MGGVGGQCRLGRCHAVPRAAAVAVGMGAVGAVFVLRQHGVRGRSMGAVVWGVGVSVVGRPGQQMHRRHRALQQHQGAQQTDQAGDGRG